MSTIFFLSFIHSLHCFIYRQFIEWLYFNFHYSIVCRRMWMSASFVNMRPIEFCWLIAGWNVIGKTLHLLLLLLLSGFRNLIPGYRKFSSIVSFCKTLRQNKRQSGILWQTILFNNYVEPAPSVEITTKSIFVKAVYCPAVNYYFCCWLKIMPTSKIAPITLPSSNNRNCKGTKYQKNNSKSSNE